jgi:hypothetical protein
MRPELRWVRVVHQAKLEVHALVEQAKVYAELEAGLAIGVMD